MEHPALIRSVQAGPYVIQVAKDSHQERGYWVQIFESESNSPDPLRVVYVLDLELVEEARGHSASWINAVGRGHIQVNTPSIFLSLQCEGFIKTFVNKVVVEHPQKRRKITASFWLRLYASTLHEMSTDVLSKISGMSRSTVHKFIVDEERDNNIFKVKRSPESYDPFPKAKLFRITKTGHSNWLSDVKVLWPLYRNAKKWPQRHEPPVAVYHVKKLLKSVFQGDDYPGDFVPGSPLDAWWGTGANTLKGGGLLRFDGSLDMYFTENAWTNHCENGHIVIKNDGVQTTRCTVVKNDAHIAKLFSAVHNAQWIIELPEPSAGLFHDRKHGSLMEMINHDPGYINIKRVPALPGHIQSLQILDAGSSHDARTVQASELAWQDFTEGALHG